jgi:uncharacterized protein with HEPN domain
MLPRDRFLYTLDLVHRAGVQLRFSHQRVFGQPVDGQWVRRLPDDPQTAERLETFVSRFGRMQDSIAVRLLPRWLEAIAETPGSQIETLNRAERLGVLPAVEPWLEARKLRNRLVHEYLDDPDAFATDLSLANGYTHLLMETYNRVREFAATRMQVAETDLPPRLPDAAAN